MWAYRLRWLGCGTVSGKSDFVSGGWCARAALAADKNCFSD